MEHLPAVTIDGGDLTVLHRIAAYTWGSWDVSWPEDYEPPEMDHDRALGFVSKLPGPEGGRFARRFVRADAQIDAENGFTNVEQILDEAAERTGGDTFFQRDVSPAELGRLVPGLHFRLGDLLPVRVWGGIMRLPVTAIDEVTEGGVVVGHTVHLGGQLVSDRGALDAQIAQTEQQIARERRERARQIEKAVEPINLDLDSAVTKYYGYTPSGISQDSRISTVTGRLVDDVDVVDGEVDNVRRGILGQAQLTQYTTLGGMNQIGDALRDKFLNNYYQDENGRTRNMLTSSQLSQAEKGLIPAYVAMNNIMWEQQLLVNAVHGEAIEALQRSIFSVTFMNAGQTATTTDGFLRFSPPNFGQTPQHVGITRLSSRWRGKIIILVNYLQISIPPDFRVQVYERTHSSFGSGTSFNLNIGAGDVQNITLFHKTDNPHQL